MNRRFVQSLHSPAQSSQGGVAAVEMGIVLGLLVVLLMAAWNFGNAIYRYDALAKAARAAVRYLSTVELSTDPGARTLDARIIIVCGRSPTAPDISPATCDKAIPDIQASMVTVQATALNPPDDLLPVTVNGVSLNMVKVQISNYPFTFSIPFVPLGTITFGPVSATMAGL
ncbi:MAG: TadE/TadG family type IV pilus assembly protein [Quisquiliibacterium sp.]